MRLRSRWAPQRKTVIWLLHLLAQSLVLVVFVYVVQDALAQTQSTIDAPVSSNAETTSEALPLTPIEYVPWHITAQADDWGLDAEQWTRYQRLMQGGAGLHYRHLSPLFVLGLYAESEAERQRYAELYAQYDAERLDQLFSFNRAFKLARAKLYPNPKRIDPTLIAERKAVLDSPLYSLKKPRLSIYLNDECLPCDELVQSLVLKEREFDVFFVNTNDEAVIQSWARRLGLPIKKVNQGLITLNFDDGWFDTYGKGDLPAVYANGQSGFTPVALEQLQ